MRRISIVLATITACSSGNRTPSSSPPPAETEAAKPPPLVTCADAVLVMEQGREVGMQCESKLRAPTVVVDLRDEWTPKLFAPGPDGKAPQFRQTYLQLALERDEAGKPLPPNLGLAELYGIVPSLAIVRARFAQPQRYACHAKIDSAPMAKLTRPYGQEHDGILKLAKYTRTVLGAQLERARQQRKLPDLTAFETDREMGPTYAKYKAADEIYSGITTAQRHLVCAGYLTDADVDGTLSWKTGTALELFQRRNFLMPNNRIDPETRTALATDPRELDFRFALRVLRERVVDATGLIEDGTASNGPQPILGRMLDPEAMRMARGHEKPLPNAAPDLVAAATEAAAKQLGWTSPADTAAFLARHPGGLRVAVVLPAAPPWHAKHMALSTEIDRGDVWYDDKPTPRIVQHRPNLVLFVDDHGTKRPLVRWPTTIGGWSDVNIPGVGIVQKWKESDVGPRVWRDLFAAPTWLPPGTTPDRDLVRWAGPGKWELKKSIMGPGPHAAFGIMLLPHYRITKLPNGRDQVIDNGIGTHGSAVVTSIVHGTSHGCHRLYNQLAVRLGTFLLAHRDHVVRGQQKEYYRRTVHFGSKAFQARIDTRGFVYELTPPVPVNVLPGNIRSERKVPPLASAPALP
ncbi:MAG TPA: peptidoglycan-binding protein [Kofleriaceae bacterium]|nr:peptidoglycan-binding protein [Kofleriaceae bacterium]